MMQSIPVNEPILNGNEKRYLNQCIDTGWISSEGPFVKQLEKDLADRVGRRYGIAVSNGSVALDAAIAALRIGPGDEVVLPTFTIVACAAAIVRAGGVPVVIDSAADTWNVDADQIESAITPRTKAIMIVHVYGLPVDMEPLIKLATKYNLAIIEDAAEMHGQTYRGKACGSFGDISTFSFYPNKHITTGEGGMILTDDKELAERCYSLRNLCFQPQRRFVHEELGWNMRMSNLQAAVGVAQLERLDEFVVRKRRMGEYYTELLADIPGLQLPLSRTSYAQNIYWVYGIVLEEGVPFDAKELMRRLSLHGIGTRPFFWPMHQQPVFKRMGLFEGVSCPVAERLAQRGFYIPSGLALCKSQMKQVAIALKEEMQ
ncbi:MAG: DegT/DnrJ/EryC1/StrS family aminotransferase [Phormidesmis sp.]